MAQKREVNKKLLYKRGEDIVDAFGSVYAGVLPVDAVDGFYYYTGLRWELCQKVEVCINTVRIGGKVFSVRYRFIGLQTESGQLVPCEQGDFLSAHNLFELDACAGFEEESSLKVVDIFAAKKAGWKSPQERESWLDHERLQAQGGKNGSL